MKWSGDHLGGGGVRENDQADHFTILFYNWKIKMFVLYSKYLFPLYLNKRPLFKDLHTTLLVCYILFCSFSFILLLIIKNGLAKNKIRGPLHAGGRGGQGWNGPRTISKYFFIFEPFPYKVLPLENSCFEISNFSIQKFKKNLNPKTIITQSIFTSALI